MRIDFPWRFYNRGRTAVTSDEDHIADMLELLVFTDPGERVNRPGFGSGLRQMVFAPNSPELAAALQFALQGAIPRELGAVLSLEELEVTAADTELRVAVSYIVLATGQRQIEELRRELT